MSDARLRGLERAAAQDPAQALAYARALERAGRGDEAWRALDQALDDPAVRAELARRPAWSSLRGPGGTRCLDVPPLRRAPRLRWAVDASDLPGAALLASPLGVVRCEHDGTPVAVHDPRDGAVRWRPEGWRDLTAGLDARLEGDALVATGAPGVRRWPLWARADIPVAPALAPAAGPDPAAGDGPLARDAAGAVLAEGPDRDDLRLVDARGRTRWVALGRALLALGPDRVIVATTVPEQPFGDAPREVLALDRASGGVRAGLGPLDDVGALAAALTRDLLLLGLEDGRLAARALDGAPVWSVDVGALAGRPGAALVALAPLPGAVVVSLLGPPDADTGTLVCLEEG